MGRVGVLCWCGVVLLLVRTPAAAQTSTPGEARLEIGGGGGFFVESDFGSVDANLRTNDPQASPYRLFSTETRLASAPSIDVQIGYLAVRYLEIGGRFTFSTPELATTLSNDVESAPALTARESLDQYLIEVGAALMLDRFSVGRMLPFVSGGAGYVRQLHEGQTLIDEGYDVYFGGGVKQQLLTRGRSRLKAMGVRAEARLRFLAGDVVFDAAVPRFAASVGVFFGF